MANHESDRVGAKIQIENQGMMDDEIVDYLLAEGDGALASDQENKYRRIVGLMLGKLQALFSVAKSEEIIIGTERAVPTQEDSGEAVKVLGQIWASVKKINPDERIYEMDFMHTLCFASPSEVRGFLKGTAQEDADIGRQPKREQNIVKSACNALIKSSLAISEEGIIEKQRDFVGCSHNLAALQEDLLPGFPPCPLKLPQETDLTIINRAFLLFFNPNMGAWEAK